MPLKKLLSVFVALIAPVLLVAFLPFNPVHADILSVNVKPKWTNFNSTWQCYVYQGAYGTNWIGSTNSCTPDAAYKNIRKVRFSLPNGIILGLGDYITADLILRQNVNNNSLDLSVGPMSSDTSGIRLISAEVAESSNIQTVVHFTFYVEQTISVSNSSTYVTVGSARGNDANIIWWFDDASISSDMQAIGGGTNYYTTVSNTDYSGKLNEISSGITNLNSKLNASNTKLDNINNSVQALKDSQDQANQDANDRYEDEKDTINENAQQGQSDSESLGNISLSLLNPLNSWKDLFTNGCSVNVPILAGWLHSPSSTYTSWWCSSSTLLNIKSVLTGVLSIVGVMIVFGFAFKWLRTNNGED